MTLLQEVQNLIENSLVLQSDPAEQWFWLAESKSMSEGGLEKLKAILEHEQAEASRIRAEEKTKLDQIDADYLKALENFKRVEMPKFVKKWEAHQRAQENPENLLNQID